MPELYVPPQLIGFGSNVSLNQQSQIGINIPYFIFENVAYPLPSIEVLAVGSFSLPSLGDVTLLTVLATQRAFITYFNAHSNLVINASLRLGTQDILRVGNISSTPLIILDHANPVNDGAIGDDISLHNYTATAVTVTATVLGFLLTP